MTYPIPPQPENSYRVTLELNSYETRLDHILIQALHEQSENETLKSLSKAHLKRLFLDKKILIKSQNARPKSRLNSGTTYVDILLA